MYIPSDFFKASFSWMDAFPLTRPFQLGHHCEFHVLHKDVENINNNDVLLDPPDADHSFSAKVGIINCFERSRVVVLALQCLFTMRIFFHSRSSTCNFDIVYVFSLKGTFFHIS